MKAAAFFDMDGTLLRCNSGTRYILWLRRRGEMSLAQVARGLSWMARHKLALLDVEAVTSRVIADMAGDAEDAMRAQCLAFFDEEVRREVAPAGRAAVDRHRAAGDVVALLTSSSPYVAEPLARHLGIAHVICTRLVIEDGRFAGRHVRPACYGAGKVHWAEAFARAEGVDLRLSAFYTDSYSDLPMLERVGAPRVVNPDPRLLRHARRVRWEIERW